jgi:hypothetical protein
MKFEITNDKLEKIIFKYLDNRNYIIKEIPDSYIFIENEDDRYAQIKIRKRDMICFISNKIAEEIETFFSVEDSMVKSILKKYVNNTLNIEVDNPIRGVFIYKSPLRTT